MANQPELGAGAVGSRVCARSRGWSLAGLESSCQADQTPCLSSRLRASSICVNTAERCVERGAYEVRMHVGGKRSCGRHDWARTCIVVSKASGPGRCFRTLSGSHCFQTMRVHTLARPACLALRSVRASSCGSESIYHARGRRTSASCSTRTMASRGTATSVTRRTRTRACGVLGQSFSRRAHERRAERRRSGAGWAVGGD